MLIFLDCKPKCTIFIYFKSNNTINRTFRLQTTLKNSQNHLTNSNTLKIIFRKPFSVFRDFLWSKIIPKPCDNVIINFFFVCLCQVQSHKNFLTIEKNLEGKIEEINFFSFFWINFFFNILIFFKCLQIYYKIDY